MNLAKRMAELGFGFTIDGRMNQSDRFCWLDRDRIILTGFSPENHKLDPVFRLKMSDNIPADRLGTEDNFKDLPIGAWPLQLSASFMKALVLASESSSMDLNNFSGCQSITVHALAAPGFSHLGFLSQSLTMLHEKLFPTAPLPQINAIGVVALPADSVFSLDMTILFDTQH